MTRRFTHSSASYCGLTILLSLLVYVDCDDGVTFLSSETIKEQSIGDTVVFECSVDNLRRHAFEWWYLDHHLQISNNETILVNDSHYSILQPLGNHGDMSPLHISPVKASDVGHYQCRISGTSMVQTHQLIVTDAPVVPKPPLQTLPPANFTDCCVREGVQPSCLPICHPSTVNLNDFDVSQCSPDLPKLVRCGADKRNHVPCCRQRLVPDVCLGFCMDDIPSVQGADFYACLVSAKQIIECFEEGQHLLPTEPFMFHVEAESSSTIHTSWQPPVENSDTVTGYRVFYKRSADMPYLSSQKLGASQLDHTLTGLEANTLYTLYVISVNSHGASQPSPRLRAATHPRNPLPPGVNRETFEQCCEHRGVTEQCRPVLCGQGPVQSNMSMTDCLLQVNKVFQCMSGERNHTACCQQQDIPSECYSLCSGQVTQLQNHQLKCISLLPKISTCFNQGAENLPGSPRNLMVKSVSTNSAGLQWSDPLENAALVQSYRIRYWVTHSEYVLQETVSGEVHSATVSDLEPATQYTMEVFAIGEKGSSIPSPAILVITLDYPLPTATETPLPVAPTNLTACCAESSVEEQCLPLCNYNFHESMADSTIPFMQCLPNLGKILSCGSDGRNHSGCCQQRMLPTECLPMCAFTQEMANNFQFEADHMVCLQHIADISMCMEEGLVSLPSSPVDVSVRPTTQTLTIKWKKPTHIPDGASLKYRLSWAQTNHTNIMEQETSDMSHTLHNLPSDTEYMMELVAVTSEGYSLPAPRIYARTRPESLPLNVSLPTNMTGCCVAKGVSNKCLAACAGSAIVDLQDCSSDIGKILGCAADGRDHSACCMRNDLPSQCESHCRGEPRTDSFLHLLCMTFVPQILTCFRQGYEDLPSPPRNFRASETGPKFATLMWQEPAQNADGVKYKLYYIGAYDTEDHLPVLDVVSPHTLSDLQPSIPYTVFLVAYNDHGTSLPTPKIQFITRANESPVITITQDPPDRYVKEGHEVILTCHASGQPIPTIKWLRNGKYHNTQEMRLGPLRSEHTGRYTCVAENGNQPVTENVILKVQYAPHVEPAKPTVYVPPSQYKIAQLQCNVLGFPDTIAWFKDGIPITDAHPDSHRYMWRREVQEDQGIIQAHFDIAAVRHTDYGMYTCKVNNTFGSHDASIRLSEPTGVSLPPGLSTAAPVTNIISCCIVEEVRESCLHICSFDINLHVLIEMPAEQQAECLQDGEKILACAADGRNHSSCCIDKNLPEQCLPFCLGVVPDPLWANQSSCVLYMEEIVDCMEEGHKLLPSPPRNLRGKLTNGFIRIWWQPPESNADKVEYYDLLYWNPDMSEFNNISLPRNISVYNLTGVHSHTEYTLQIEARNHRGTSIKSNRIFITTYEMVPSEPHSLSGTTLTDAGVLLHWSIPLKYSGAVISYNVHYAVSHFHPHYLVVNTHSPNVRYMLQDLEPDTNYSIYITAVSSHFESKPSNLITVFTEGWPEKHKSSVIIPVVCVLVVLAIVVALIVFLYWYFRNRRVSHQRFKDTVSFENPGYASRGSANGSAGESREARAWISGLPSEAVMTTTGDSALPQPHNSVVQDRGGVTASNGHINTGQGSGQRGVEGGGGDLVYADSGPSLVHKGDREYNSSIMREVDSNSDQGYSTLSHSTRAELTGPENAHSYATLDITQLNPAEADNVHLDVDNSQSEVC